MMKTISYLRQLLLATLLVGGLASCVKEEVSPKDVVAFAQTEQTIVFTAQGGTQTLALKGTQTESAQVSTNVAWARAKATSQGVVLTAEANTAPQAREGQLRLIAQGQVSTLHFKQQGADEQFTLSQNELTASQWGGTYLLDVDAFEGVASLATSDSWLTAEARNASKQVAITLEENTEAEGRTATLKVVSTAGNVRTFIVRQDAAMTYLLPYLSWNASDREVRRFELARHSSVQGFPSAITGTDVYTYALYSPIFTKVEYLHLNSAYKAATLYLASVEELMGERFEALKRYLVEQGFVLTKRNTYWHEEKAAEIEIEGLPGTAKEMAAPALSFTIRPKQPHSFPTLPRLVPEGFDYQLDLASMNKVKEREAALGSTLNTRYSSQNYLFFNVLDPEGLGAFSRAYEFTLTGEKGQFIQSFDKLELAVHLYEGSYYLTDELVDLLHNEGYEFLQTLAGQNTFQFVNKERGTLLSVFVINQRDTGKPRIFINIMNQPKANKE